MTENQQTDALFAHLFGSLNRYHPDSESGFCLAERGEFLRRDEVLAAATHQRKRDRDAVAGLLLLPREENEDWNEAIHSALAILDAPRTYDPNGECCAGDGLQGDGKTPCPCGTLPAPMPASAVEPMTDLPSDGTCMKCGCAPRNAEGLCATCVDERADLASPPPAAAPTDNTALILEIIEWCHNQKGTYPDWFDRARKAVGLFDGDAGQSTDNTALVEVLDVEATAENIAKQMAAIENFEGFTGRYHAVTLRVAKVAAETGIRAALASLPAAPAEGDVGALSLEDLICSVLRGHYLAESHDEDGFAVPLIDALMPDNGDVELGEREIMSIANKLAAALRPQSSAQGGEA